MKHFTRFTSWAALAVAISSSVVLAQTPRRAMPPQVVDANGADAAKLQAAPLSLWLPASAVSRSVAAAIVDATKASAAVDLTVDHRKPQAIGADRALAETDRRIALDTLQWYPLADGGLAARVRVDVAGAVSVRLGYRLDGFDGSAVRIGSADAAYVEAGSAPAQDGALRWTTPIDGSAAVVDIRVDSEKAIAGKALVIEHAVGLDVTRNLQKRAEDIGTSGACEIDLACVSNPSTALLQAARSVAKIMFSSRDGRTYACSATLITNDSNRNLLYTANHCIGDDTEANSTVTYWNFEAATCGSRAVPSFQTVGGGTRRVFNDARLDVSIAEMVAAPPSFAVRAGWDAGMLRRADTVTTLHHPSGDLKKYSSGSGVGYTNVQNVIPQDVPWITLPGDQTSSYYTVLWTQGSTEGGSSGAGLLTYDQSSLCPNGCYLFRGGLAQGSASCSAPNSPDRFSRFDLAFSYVASVLAPDLAPVSMNGSIATEYYNATNDHYFLTAYADEAAGLDTAATRASGWYRTGEQIGIWPSGTAGTTSVCRFYGDVANGGPNSHFYTADPAECAAVAQRGSGWSLEATDAFRVRLPIGASCPTGTTPIYRVYNYHGTPTYRNTLTGRLGYDSNHRYFTNSTLFDVMLEKDTWGLEPVGRVPVMCARQ